MRYVIAYDIVENKRRQKLSDYLSDRGRRVQKSVFECDLSGEALRQLCTWLEQLLRVPPDRCQIYPLCADCAARRRRYGQELEPAWTAAIVV